MNVVDKLVTAINPVKGLERERARIALQAVRDFKNSGYSHSGASKTKKATAGWVYSSLSPQEDIDFSLNTLRQRSRDMYMSAPIATSAIKNNRTNVVGAGLKLKSKLDHNILHISEDQARMYEVQFENEFNLWAASQFCDAIGLNNHFEQQQLALASCLMNGDVIAIPKYRSKALPYMPYTLNILLVEADRLSTPGVLSPNGSAVIKRLPGGNRIYSGVELDSSGLVVAYHICNTYPESSLNGIRKEWTRVEAIGKATGNRNIIHILESERCNQYRGVPYLAPVMEALKQMTRYTEAELMAAVITAFFTAFIKTSGDTSEIPIGESIDDTMQVLEDKIDMPKYELGSGTINVLGLDEDVIFADPKRPASGFDMFMTAIITQIGAALEIPQEMITKKFSASYSASRAAFLEAWKMFRMRRTWFATRFCQPVYELFLSEAVAIGRVKAPGFFADPLLRRAYCGAEWNGPSPGQIDPTKEVQASILKVANGFSTRTKETMELTGGDFAQNAQQLKREDEMLGIAAGEKGGTETND